MDRDRVIGYLAAADDDELAELLAEARPADPAMQPSITRTEESHPVNDYMAQRNNVNAQLRHEAAKLAEMRPNNGLHPVTEPIDGLARLADLGLGFDGQRAEQNHAGGQSMEADRQAAVQARRQAAAHEEAAKLRGPGIV